MSTRIGVAEVTEVRSHWIQGEYERSPKASREELYPCVTIDAAGQTRSVRLEARRYVDSEGRWGSWTVLLGNVEPSQGIAEKTRAAIREVAVPLVRDWLESPQYQFSRARTFAYWIKRAFREVDSDYKVRDAEEILRENGDELEVGDREALTEALEHARRMVELLDTVPGSARNE